MAEYQLQLAHLYGNLLNTYGDLGNIMALKYYGQLLDTDVTSKVISVEDDFKAADYDLIVIGAGQKFEQSIALEDIPSKHDELQKFIEAGKPMLAVGEGYQLLGQSYIDQHDQKVAGAGLLSHHSELPADGEPIQNDLVIKTKWGIDFHGHENHDLVTFLGDNEEALGKVIEGTGNNHDDDTEGAIYKNTFCTNMHTVLDRNGELAKRMLITALANKYPDADLSAQRAVKIEPTY
ncbi:type 1 glutamine amidotransferase [Limosilactobacillus viscerum]|uniref:type 1 glutamine amidotransferase n=1 Tax=Limosilactobacillus viscerum TaxID=2993450 RepID=UPI0024B9F080|nr:glutamine amidotransferase [Limosilactobacillus viscerum]